MASGRGDSEVERAVLARLADGVHKRLAGLSAEEAARLDPDWVADVMLNAIPTAHPFEGFGPFYDTGGLIRWLGISRQALHQKVRSRQLLAPVTGNGQRVYPAWQFAPDGSSLPGLSGVLTALLEATDEWTAAIWLTTPSARLQGKSAVEVLGCRPGGTGAQAVLALAREDADRWSQ